MSAFGGKADIDGHASISAFDPKRTLVFCNSGLSYPAEIERIKRLISELYADRVRLHQNPEKYGGGLSWEAP